MAALRWTADREVYPPVTSTRPSCSSVAVNSERERSMGRGADQAPVLGLYASRVLRSDVPPASKPPNTRTVPFRSRSGEAPLRDRCRGRAVVHWPRPAGCRGVTELEGDDGGPTPRWLIADTRKRTATPLRRPVSRTACAPDSAESARTRQVRPVDAVMR